MEGEAEAVLYYARGLQEYHRGLFEVLVGGLAPLLTAVGLPRGYIESELFLGRYSATPGGIHREGCTNLHMVLQGKKVMHLWNTSDWIPEGTDLRADTDPLGNVEEEYLPGLAVADVEHLTTTTLRPGAGQAMFWRSGIWHVGDTPEPSLSFNVAMYTGSFDNPRPWTDVPVGTDGQLRRGWLAEYREFAGSPRPTPRRWPSYRRSACAASPRRTRSRSRPRPRYGAGRPPRCCGRTTTTAPCWSPPTERRAGSPPKPSAGSSIWSAVPWTRPGRCPPKPGTWPAG